MRDFASYASVIYDANCIVYYGFDVSEQNAEGKDVPVKHPETVRVREITERLVAEKKTVKTLAAAWTEAAKVANGRAIDDQIKKGIIQEQLGIPKSPVPHALSLRIVKKVKESVAAIAKTSWFSIESKYQAMGKDVEALQATYVKFCQDPANHQKIRPGKGDPSPTDLQLILFSKDSKSPLLTNDQEIYVFANELKAGGYCELIKGLPLVKL